MIRLAFTNLWRRPVRSVLAMLGVMFGVAVWLGLVAIGDGYQRGLRTELDRVGMQLMLVPLGCPYDAASRVLKGRTLENSMPAAVLEAVRNDPAVALAAPLLIAAVPRDSERRTDLWVGLDAAARGLKPWWKVSAGRDWFSRSNGVILGVEAAHTELRSPGDSLNSPELGTTFQVEGILERSGTSDDSLFFLPLDRAQQLFGQHDRLTAVAIRLKDPTTLRAAVERLQQIPGAQVVTMTEMMGTFLRLLGTVRSLLVAVTWVTCAVGILGVLNTLLAAVVERSMELCLFRAMGASRWQIAALIVVEAEVLALLGAMAGIALVGVTGPWIEELARPFVPLAPLSQFMEISGPRVAQGLGVTLLGAVVASILPAWHASRLPPALAAKSE